MIKKEEISKLIVEEKKNKFLSHLNIIKSFDFTRYYGEVREHEILLWSSSFWLRFNYPIFVLKFNSRQELCGIKIEKNPFDKFVKKVFLFLLAAYIAGFFTMLETRAAIVLSLILLVFSMLFYMLIKNRTAFERKNLLLDLEKEIYTIELRSNPAINSKVNREKEKVKKFTFPKILLRLILYPFCLGIIYLSIVLFLPSDEPVYGIVLTGIGLAYLVTDLLIIFRNSPQKQ